MIFTLLKKYNIKYLDLAFVFVLVAVFFFLGFIKVFFAEPYGIHFMRQTDSLSFASMYFENGFHFFKPQLFNLKNVEGYAACEFPIVYYLTAILYAVFGKNFFILKLLHLLILYTGVFYIYKLIRLFLNSFVYAALLSLLLFTSTVFNYYSFNFLPDVAALGFVFTGWYFIFKYDAGGLNKNAILSFVFFMLGSLIKVTYLINPLAVMAIALISIIIKPNSLFDKNKAKSIILYGFSAVFMVLLWNVYMLKYNALYDSASFNTGAHPIWDTSPDRIAVVWDHVTNYWYNSYFAKSSFHLLFILLIFQLVFYKKAQAKLLLISLTLFLGSLSYFILFYLQFQDHDYYFLAFFPSIVLILLSAVKTLQNLTSNRYMHVFFKVILFTIVISGINYSKQKLNERHALGIDMYSESGLLVHANSAKIEKLNLPIDSKFIVAPDRCQNGALFFLNRMGWNIRTNKDITEQNISHFKSLGAEYLLLTTEDENANEIAKAHGTPIFIGDGVKIFKLLNIPIH